MAKSVFEDAAREIFRRSGESDWRILDPAYEPEVTGNGRYLLEFRYLTPLPGGGFERPVDMYRRVAWNLAGAEERFQPGLTREALLEVAESFFRVMTAGEFLPNAPTLLGAGRPLQQLSACFVLPVGDSIHEIFDTVRMAAISHSRGSGTGFSFSHLRQRGAPISTGGVSTGPVSFLSVIDAETEVIKQGGTGWGANMAVLRCDHPDIREFITAKSATRGALINFNLSVGITTAFMDRLAAGGIWELRDPRSGETVESLPARELWDLICQEAWKTGDPGLLFLDRINEDNPLPMLGPLEATNPCGEAPLMPFEACFLAAINVSRYYDSGNGDVHWSAVEECAALAVRMMDNVIEMNRFPLDEIDRVTRSNRKVGIGVMGFADLLIRMGIPYASTEAETLAARLMSKIQAATREASRELARERGSFGTIESSVWPERGYPVLRNATTTSNAPNSSISCIAGCSSGIEPLFSLAYKKRLLNGSTLTEVHPALLNAARQRGLEFEGQIDSGPGSQALEEVPAEWRRVFATAHEISPEWHIRIQSAFQRYTDLAVSKTINLPNCATRQDIGNAFELAHKLRCKGVTCFRDGCRDTQFLTSEGPEEGPACPRCR